MLVLHWACCVFVIQIASSLPKGSVAHAAVEAFQQELKQVSAHINKLLANNRLRKRLAGSLDRAADQMESTGGSDGNTTAISELQALRVCILGCSVV